MSDSIQICLADKHDLQGIDALEQRCFHGHSYPDFFFRQALDCWPAGFLVAKDNQANVVGYLLASSGTEAHLCWLLSLAVCNEQRGTCEVQSEKRNVQRAKCNAQSAIICNVPMMFWPTSIL